MRGAWLDVGGGVGGGGICVGGRLLGGFGGGAEQAEHGGGGVGKRAAAAIEQVEVAGHAQLADFDFDQQALLDFPAHAHARDDGHAHVHLHEALDAFDGGQLDAHFERHVVLGEELQ